VEVFVVGASSYGDQEFRETLLYKEGDEFVVEWPNRIYLTVVSK
jgi:hypothetical protein